MQTDLFELEAAACDPLLRALRGVCPPMQALRRWLVRAAPHAAPALLLGESGTGKELAAQALAQMGARRGQPWVTLNCGALAPQLVAAELFGHQRGAFTGAVAPAAGAFVSADGGSLFLDEVGELPLSAQVQLLRALESGEVRPVGSSRSRRVSVRIIAATHRDLAREVRRGRFRADLFYRLHVLSTTLPSLRARCEDIAELAAAFLAADAGPHAPALQLAPAALQRLQAHLWPGNVRELRHTLWRASLDATGGVITLADLSFSPNLQAGAAEGGGRALLPPRPLRRLKEIQERAILRALRRHRGNRTQAAVALGISRATLHRRLLDMGLTAT